MNACFRRLSVGPLLVAATLTISSTMHAFAAEKEVITFAASPFSSARGPQLQDWVKKFNDSQENIEVTPIAIPFASFANTMFTQMGGKGGPDLVRFDLYDFYPAVAANLIMPIDGIIEDEASLRPVDKYLKVDGKRYGIAFEISNYALIYNKALLKDGKVPTNFAEFIASAKAASGDGVYGFAYRATMAESGGFWQDVCNFVYGFGGRWSDDSGKLTLNSPEVVAGIAAYKQVYDLDVTPKGADAATFRRMFSQGKVAMEIDNSAVMASLMVKGPDLPIEVARSPFPTDAQGFVLSPITVNANTKHKEAALAFLKWMMLPESQRALETAYGGSSFVATPVAYTEEELAKRPWLKVYDSDKAVSIPQLVSGHEIKTPEIQRIVLEQVVKVLQTDLDPQAAMDEAQKMAEGRVLPK
ncbi:sugar ABC transporter substrate-binding protein [Phyllobacterium endophyticum]|uniref:Sugar ABC transporter substrate-binding protein n=2 Tax=Phyllobacterium endophyticum TaxID=1149773 RepID=A0A2P7AR00_9HYPH|nr:sugar ABC transporter substrate-binding protein [Phyllobacterium endophyticum]PSH56655.1 sugar ABC transporter substrate-binding protein [Phyllobacterium endophyticum]TYR44351.1 sugar ABC transporter substrate-binding protein [Phyllobacterium endophyticum]